MNVTFVPEQIADPGVPEIVTPGVTIGVIVIATVLEFPVHEPFVTTAL